MTSSSCRALVISNKLLFQNQLKGCKKIDFGVLHFNFYWPKIIIIIIFFFHKITLLKHKYELKIYKYIS